MYRDPITNRFVAGNPPERTPEGFPVSGTQPEQANEPSRGRDSSLGGWDYLHLAGQPNPGCTANTDDEVHDIRDVMGIPDYGAKNRPTQSDETIPFDDTTSSTTHPHKDGGDGPVGFPR